jgi:hypothetical protein
MEGEGGNRDSIQLLCMKGKKKGIGYEGGEWRKE